VTIGNAPQDFDTYQRAEAAKWGPIPEQANIRVE